MVGGHSRRMGRDKARLPLASELLIESLARKVQHAAGSVCLVGAAARYRDLAIDTIDDLRSSCGPLAGIEAALHSNRGDFNLIVACDMPGLDESWLHELLTHARRTDARCLISQDPDGTLHPLCSVWRADCLEHVTRALDQSRLRLLDLVRELNARALASPQPLANINTPEEWHSWQLTR